MPPLLITNLINIRYLTGVSMTAGIMLLDGKRKLLFVDDRYTEKARSDARKGITVLHIDEFKKTLSSLRSVRFEADDVNVARLNRWKKLYKKTTFIPSEGVVGEMRRKKTQEEISLTKKACRITDIVLKTIGRNISVRRGVACYAPTRGPTIVAVTEKHLAWEIESLSHDLGADTMAFETIVAFGEHTSRPHHRPTDRKLKTGDIIQIDMGVKVKGYCSDCSRMFFTADLTSEQQEVFDLLVSIVKDCTIKAKAGASNHSLDKYARKTLKRHLIPTLTRTQTLDQFFLHSLGHGVGLEVHEGINLSSRAKGKHKKKLITNEIITVEPGIYLPGQWGMRIEDTIRVTKTGGKRMTKVQYALRKGK